MSVTKGRVTGSRAIQQDPEQNNNKIVLKNWSEPKYVCFTFTSLCDAVECGKNMYKFWSGKVFLIIDSFFLTCTLNLVLKRKTVVEKFFVFTQLNSVKTFNFFSQSEY